jgi:hypothetical protein
MLKEEPVDEDEGGRLMDVTQTCTAPFAVRLGPSCMKKTPDIADSTRIENNGRLCRIVNLSHLSRAGKILEPELEIISTC